MVQTAGATSLHLPYPVHPLLVDILQVASLVHPDELADRVILHPIVAVLEGRPLLNLPILLPIMSLTG